MSEGGGLKPPDEANVSDPGARQLESSDSEDSFTDAQSGPRTPSVSSPVPRTRVERVDDEQAHGEVPGTEAHAIRQEDAQPDEIAVISDPTSQQTTSSTPKTVVEEAPGESGPHSVGFLQKRMADAEPDVVVSADGKTKSGNKDDDSTMSSITSSPETSPTSQSIPQAVENDEGGEERSSLVGDDDDFGDDFDDFEEGAQANDDFDDFDEGFQEAKNPIASFASNMVLPFPMPDFDGLSPDEILSTTEPLLDSLFPPEELDLPEFPTLPKDSSSSSVFLTPRSASLWSQLVAPPPLAPPDWIRSRTRRLFLVSLGVPVDLDEILPASKQKKLVLPSLKLSSISPRTSSDSRSVSRLRQGEGNASSTSVDSQGKPRASNSKRQKGPPPQPELDVVAGRHLCMTTGEALDGMTDEELAAHVERLKAMEGTAKEVLEYWKKRTDEKIGDREAFEGVIENLVKHARKVRK